MMLDSLITSKTRIKLLLKFFLNPSMKSHLRGLADEFGESTNAIRLELNHLTDAGMLESCMVGNKKVFNANPNHPLFKEIRSLVLKHSGITQIVEEIIVRLGRVTKVWVLDGFAEGKDSDVITILLLGESIDIDYFNVLKIKAEKLIGRKIEYFIAISDHEAFTTLANKSKWLIWER